VQIELLEIEDIFVIAPAKHGDHRGFFSETYRSDSLRAHGLNVSFVQDNHVYSTERGVLRGLHYQSPPHAQGKLVRCIRGSILDVGVDIRDGSPTFGRHIAIELSAANWKQLWLPPGFAHGYITLEADCEVIYKVTDYYARECEAGIAWDDPNLGIDWRMSTTDLVLSEKDRKNPRLADIVPPFQYNQHSQRGH
jgi:dTDP-4-dehydrorhamnose 3,5-epimerase